MFAERRRTGSARELYNTDDAAPNNAVPGECEEEVSNIKQESMATEDEDSQQAVAKL